MEYMLLSAGDTEFVHWWEVVCSSQCPLSEVPLWITQAQPWRQYPLGFGNDANNFTRGRVYSNSSSRGGNGRWNIKFTEFSQRRTLSLSPDHQRTRDGHLDKEACH